MRLLRNRLTRRRLLPSLFGALLASTAFAASAVDGAGYAAGMEDCTCIKYVPKPGSKIKNQCVKWRCPPIEIPTPFPGF